MTQYEQAAHPSLGSDLRAIRDAAEREQWLRAMRDRHAACDENCGSRWLLDALVAARDPASLAAVRAEIQTARLFLAMGMPRHDHKDHADCLEALRALERALGLLEGES